MGFSLSQSSNSAKREGGDRKPRFVYRQLSFEVVSLWKKKQKKSQSFTHSHSQTTTNTHTHTHTQINPYNQSSISNKHTKKNKNEYESQTTERMGRRSSKSKDERVIVFLIFKSHKENQKFQQKHEKGTRFVRFTDCGSSDSASGVQAQSLCEGVEKRSRREDAISESKIQSCAS